MNVTTRALMLADAAVALAKASTTRADDIKLYDEALTVIRKARAEQDHIADAGKVIAEPVRQEPVAWHHPECEGECVACLIERCVKDSYGKKGVDYMLRHMNAAPIQPVKQEPVARPFECWSTNDGDSWFEHPADAQLIYDVLGDDPKVGDEFEVSAGWNCVTATYQIASKDGDDFEVKCVSHPNNDAAPLDAKAIRAEALEEAAKWFEGKVGQADLRDIATAIRGLK